MYKLSAIKKEKFNTNPEHNINSSVPGDSVNYLLNKEAIYNIGVLLQSQTVWRGLINFTF